MIDLRKNMKAFCPVCPNSLVCVANGWVPMSIRYDFDFNTMGDGKERCYIKCDPFLHGAPLGWRLKTVKFDIPKEEALAL